MSKTFKLNPVGKIKPVVFLEKEEIEDFIEALKWERKTRSSSDWEQVKWLKEIKKLEVLL